MRILITGSTGMVGKFLCQSLGQLDHVVIDVSRNSGNSSAFTIDHIGPNTNWSHVLSSKIDVVIHLAAHVPFSTGNSSFELLSFHEVNHLGTQNLAAQCAQFGVTRFIFISSIKALGVSADGTSVPIDSYPSDPYGSSKWHAEQALLEIAKTSNMEVVILRPPVIYGPGMKGYLLFLIRAIDRGYPFPFAAINNRRSLLFVGNLVDAIILAMTEPKAAGKTYFLSDGDDVSTPELIRRIAHALNRPALLFAVPETVLRWVAFIFGKRSVADRLLGSLFVNSHAICDDLAWRPPYSMAQGLAVTAQWYRKAKVAQS